MLGNPGTTDISLPEHLLFPWLGVWWHQDPDSHTLWRRLGNLLPTARLVVGWGPVMAPGLGSSRVRPKDSGVPQAPHLVRVPPTMGFINHM